jgi:hypothetical protein
MIRVIIKNVLSVIFKPLNSFTVFKPWWDWLHSNKYTIRKVKLVKLVFIEVLEVVFKTRHMLLPGFKYGIELVYKKESVCGIYTTVENIKIRIYKTIILPVVLYGCET